MINTVSDTDNGMASRENDIGADAYIIRHQSYNVPAVTTKNKNGASKHVIIATVDNNPGVVSRISGLFTRRGYNVESFVTCMTLDPAVYHLTISVISTKEELELLIHQLGRIMEVISIVSADENECVCRELMFIKVSADEAGRGDVIRLADVMSLRVAAIGENSVIIEAAGDELKLEGIIRAFKPFGITELARSGTIAMEI